MEQPLIPVSQALNQIQSWLNAGQAEQAIQGCQEVLKIEPGNTRAMALLRQAYEMQNPTQSAPQIDPLQNLQVEVAPQPAQPVAQPVTQPTPQPAPIGPSHEDHPDDLFEQPKLNLSLTWAVLIPLVIAIGVAGIITMKINQGKPSEVNTGGETTLESEDHLKANETRVSELQRMNTAIQDFYGEKGAYPTSAEIKTLIESNAELKTLADPRHGEKDKAGQVFAYLYRVYQTPAGPNTGYTLTALFENSQGFGTEWGFGNQLESSEESRDLKFAVVIGPELDEKNLEQPNDSTQESENRPTGPKVKPKSE